MTATMSKRRNSPVQPGLLLRSPVENDQVDMQPNFTLRRTFQVKSHHTT